MTGSIIDIVILAAIAAFLVFRLRSVLGRRTGNEERPTYDPFKPRNEQQQPQNDGQEKVIHLPQRDGEPQAEPIETGHPSLDGTLTQIKLADGLFDVETFLGGARAAFEIVVNAFAAGDEKALRPLLSNDVFNDFSGAIAERKAEKQTLETTLVGIRSAEITGAEFQGKTAFVTVTFVSEQINVTRDAEGEVVDGDPTHVVAVTDVWTFARNTRSRDPNWTLVRTDGNA